ncbi:hypothetical protein SETIT_1G078700v2 [Setaria italica]|uniref:Uncharacterized protein n=1 Tax=Setaria italica TaxID=4555 RepID=A0A368PHV6_SETIT|nr:hypothetical protein SETIT_1G078700v2 [Setaria italica]
MPNHYQTLQANKIDRTNQAQKPSTDPDAHVCIRNNLENTSRSNKVGNPICKPPRIPPTIPDLRTPTTISAASVTSECLVGVAASSVCILWGVAVWSVCPRQSTWEAAGRELGTALGGVSWAQMVHMTGWQEEFDGLVVG